MALKQATRSATVAFSPTAPFIAAGTMAGAFDMSFSTTACMEIFKLDFSTPDFDLPLIGTAPASERLHRLSWGTTGIDSQSLPYGMIAGGQSDGSVALWNPAKLIKGGDGAGDEVGDALIGKLDKHKGSVKGLEFNTSNPNLLATGGEDGELNIWDLAKPAQPTLFPSLKSASGPLGEISYLAWNRKVPNILASTSYNGTSVVWDLKKQKSVISFADPTSRRRCSALQWNPEVATQLVVASDEDRSPGLQVWDLRNSVSPLKELQAHSRGVLAMAWCPSDSGLLLTCGKDNRTLCWDINTGEVLYELPASTNWNFDVQWSARIPGLLSTSSFDGKVQIYNIESCGATSALEEAGFGQQDGTAQPSFKRAPKWLRRPAGVSFGFGGKLVTFGPKKATNDPEITVRSINTDGDLAKRSEEFETSVKGAEKEGMKQYCEGKAASATSEDEKETWSFLSVLFGDDPRRQLLKHLNFEPAPPASAAAPTAEDPSTAAAAATNGVQDLSLDAAKAQTDTLAAMAVEENGENADGLKEPEEEDFFEKLPSTPPADTKVVETVRAPEVAEHHVEDKHVAEDDPSENAVQRALVVGNYQAAVDVCLKAGRLADALLLASVAGSDLWQSTQTEYLKRVKRPYTKIIAAVVSSDWRSLVAERPLSLWKETLALICTYSAQGDECTALCGQLAAKLAARRDQEFQQAATLCYMIAGDIEKAAAQWSKDLKKVAGSTEAGPPVDAIQDVMEKVVVLGLATGRKKVSASLAPLVGTYAELLVNQGRLATAMEYLALIPPDESDVRLKVLRDRIYRSGQIAPESVEAPEFPFEGESVSAPGVAAPANPQATAGTQAYYAPQPTQPQQSQAYQGAQYQQQTAPLNPYAPTANPYAPVPVAPTQQSWQQYNVQSAPPAPPPSVPPFNPAGHVEQRTQPGFQPVQQPAPFVPKYTPPPTNMPPPFVPQQPEAPLAAPPQRPPPSFQPKSFEAPNLPNPAAAQGAQPAYGHQPPQPFMQPGVQQPAQSFRPPQQFMQPTPSVVGPPPAPVWTPGGASNFAPPPAVAPAPPLPPINTQSTPPPRFIPSNPAQPPAPFTQPVSPVVAPQPAPQAPPPVPAGPPPTVHTADVSKVKAELKPVVAVITKLFDEVAGAMPPSRKKETEDSSKKLGLLFVKLNTGDVSAALTEKLQRVAQAIAAGDIPTAKHVQVEMTTTHWDEGSQWMPVLKRLIHARSTMR